MTEIEERFKQVNGYEDYLISDYGRVFSLKYGKPKELSAKGKFNKDRYLQVCLSNDNKKKYMQIHRLVAMHFCDGYFNGAVVNHKDCNIHNNYYLNLEWVTQKENIHKSYANSGVNQARNYSYYNLYSPDGSVIATIKGASESLRRVIQELRLDVSYSSLRKYFKSNGYHLEKVDSGNCNDYPAPEYMTSEILAWKRHETA